MVIWIYGHYQIVNDFWSGKQGTLKKAPVGSTETLFTARGLPGMG